MKKLARCFMALLVIFWCAGGSDATAATYRIVATPTGTGYSGFEIVWEDTQGEGFNDGYLDQKIAPYFPGSGSDPEMQSANANPFFVSWNGWNYNWLMSVGGALETFTLGGLGNWGFYAGGDLDFAPVDAWTYTREVVPLPPSVFLLGTGLLGLGLLGRRQRLS